MTEFKDLNELLNIARNINEGKYDIVDVTTDPENELYDIAQYFNDSLKKLTTVSQVVKKAYDGIPAFEHVLECVIDDSKKASENVLSCLDKINFNIDEVKENLRLVEQFVESGDYARATGMVERVLSEANNGKAICYDIVASLEFKETTRSNIDSSLNIVSLLENRIATLLIKLGIKQNVIDVEVLDNMKETKEILQNQDLVDKLLKEFGV